MPALLETLTFQRRHWIPLVAFVICALAMGLVWQGINARIQRSQNDQFSADTHLITTRLGERMSGSVLMLRGASGLFAANGNVTRNAWRRYVWELNLNQSPRGVETMAFARYLPVAARDTYVAEVRHEGYQDFDLWPIGARPEYASVHFVEPFSGSSLQAFGFDLLSDPIRRQALELARDTGEAVFSGSVHALDNDAGSGNTNIEVYYPVYGGSEVPKSREERHLRLQGWVYLSFRMTDLIDALLSQQLQQIRLEVFDGEGVDPPSLIYDSQHAHSTAGGNVPMQQTVRLALDGRVWTLRYTALPAYGNRLRGDSAWVVLGAMVVISLLLFGMTWAFVNTRQRALRIAERLTASLRSSEERYRSIFSHSGVTALLVDPMTCSLVEANEAAEKYYGIAAVELRRMPLTHLVSLDEEALRVMLQDALSERRNHAFQQHRLKSGLLREVEVHAGPISLEGRRLLYCVVHDVTERHEAENAVLDLNQRYQALLDAASEVAIVATDTGGLITVFNRGAERLLGYASLDMVGRMTPIAFHDGREILARGAELGQQLGYPVNGFHTLVELALIHGSEQREWTYVRKDGSRCRVSMSVTPVRAVDGHITGYLIVALDISRLKEAEASLMQAKEAAEQASRAKSAFLATMSHEIRTPMNGVIGMAQLLQGTPLSTEQQEYAEIIISSAESLLIIINDILDFSKVEAGKLELENLPFEPRTLLAGVVGMFQPQTRARGIDLRLEADARLPQCLLGDAARLRQVLVNLLGNAVKFTEHGSIRVEVVVNRQTDVSVNLTFAIVDTGVGMAPEVVRGLFAPFYQGDSSITRRFGGTGLGLSITRGLVELMGGHIDAESTLGVGSRFEVRVDLSVPAAGEIVHAPAILSHDPAFAHARVLVVDDALTNQKVALQMLGKIGLQGLAAGNGEEALRLLTKEHFDLVLMDCQMPVLDGFSATRMIRSGVAGEHMRSVPVIAMTANALVGDRERCLQAGMNDYLAKPIVLDELRYKLLQWLATVSDLRRASVPSPRAEVDSVLVFDFPEVLKHCGGDHGLAVAVIEAGLSEAPQQMEAFESVLRSGDLSQIAASAHVLIGIFAQLGGKKMALCLRAIEQSARRGQAPAESCASELLREYAALHEAIHATVLDA